MVQGNTVRPLPSTLSSTSSIISGKRRTRSKGANVWLWSACAFLLVLCAVLLAALIVVAKRASLPPHHHYIEDENISYRAVTHHQLVPAPNNNKSVIVLPNQSSQDFADSGRDREQVLSSGNNMAQRFAKELTFRLQKDVKPLLYKLEFFPDLLNTKKFNGTVEIDLDVLNPVPYIAIHSKQLQISNTSLQAILNSGQIGAPVKIANSYAFDKFEYWVTEFEKPIDTGRYKFSLSFDGSLADRIVGFYSSSYFSPLKNATRAIATTKFEPTYARQAFPCFDEPDKKAQFDISVIRPTGDDYMALSNMNEVSSTDLEGGVTRTTFNRSVPMSTYLACFIVCDFAKKSAVIESSGIGQNVELRVFATPHQLNKVDVALDAAKKITEFYIRYFNLAYPLPKLDLIAIPDFVSGAMEHWGLLAFRETAMLYEKGVSSSRNKQRVVTVIAHELAHQWFGNLVTMEFWNDLWLNEGFASYIEYMGTEVVHADWGMREQFLVDDFYRVISIDASLGTHPIVQNVSSPDQITEIFDAITYSKGATVIRMLEDIIGAENFKKAVSSYLEKFKYGNAITEDLLNEIESLELGIDIKVIMDTWTLQGGVPVVNVERSGEGQYTLTQKRFFSNPANEAAELPPSIFNYRWYIPVTYATDASENVSRTWFPHTDSQLKVDVGEKHKWIKFNKDQKGYFLVNYAPDMWASLTAALKEDLKSFSVSDRVQLLNDAFLLAEATQLDYKVTMELTGYLVKESQYVPWSVAIGNLHAIRKLIYREPVVASLQKYGLRLIENIYKDLGWAVNEEEHQKNLLRSEVLSFACSLKHEECLARSKEEFLKWMANPSVRPHPDIRTVIYNYGMEVAGNESTWQQVWELFLQELDAQEKVKLMGSLARVQDPSILSRFIKLAWDEKNVRRQDYFSCLAMISNNRVGEPLVWDYVRMNWEVMVKRFGLNERYLGSLIPSITDAFTTEMRLQEIKEFFAKYPEAGAGARSRVMALETVQKNIKWLNLNLEPLSEWLNSNAV